MDYQGLLAWQRAMDLCDEIYRLTSNFPSQEMFGLTSQLRKSAISVASNIAEGEGRLTRGERKQSLGHARGSLYEVETQLFIARRVGYTLPNAVFALVLDAKRTLEGYLGYVGKE
jgi:four helix bundle protein